MAGSDRRRKRPTKSCLLCRQRKLRCDRMVPCSNCRRSRSGTCQYENGSGAGDGTPSHTTNDSTQEALTPLSLDSGATFQKRQSSKVINSGVSEVGGSASQPHITKDGLELQTSSCELAGTWHIYTDGSKNNTIRSNVIRGFAHKTRMFGASHWALSGVALSLDTFQSAEHCSMPGTMEAAVEVLQKCKTLGRLIKARRAPVWPCPPSADLPEKRLADALLRSYLDTCESIQRILHIPTFMRHYEELFAGTKHDIGFTVQVKLVLAIGAVTYDDRFSLRTSAIRWVYEAQCYMSEPKFKSRLALQGLQTQALLIIAHEWVGIGGDPTFVSVGSLLRKAMHMGLHRDPKYLPKKSTLSDEMRRRLWNTILEMNLQSSLSTGAPATLTIDDFDAEAPENFDDDDLAKDEAIPATMNVLTQTSVALILRKSFPARLAIVRFLNNIQSSLSYEETIRHDQTIRTAHRSAVKALQTMRSLDNTTDIQFQLRVVELTFLRYIIALHAPYIGAALHDTCYAFSRKAIVDASSRVWHLISLKSTLATPTPSSTVNQPDTASRKIWRLTTCGSGFFAIVNMHAGHILAVECRSLLEEQDSLGPLLVRQDLLAIVDEAGQVCLSALEAGKVNVRGYQLISIILAQINALTSGLDITDTANLIVSAAKEASDVCLPILERHAAELADASSLASLCEPTELTENDLLDDWGFMTAEPVFYADQGQAMNWRNDDDIGLSQLW